MKRRIWEIDFFRGVAILVMVLFHVIVDLKDFYGYPFEYLSGFWYCVGKFGAILFILLAGISTVLSTALAKHGAVVFGWGMVLTLVTYIYNPYYYIGFGILHFMGVCILFARFFKPLPPGILLGIAVMLLAIGYTFRGMVVNSPYLFPLGLTTGSYSAMDYYPLLPWSGVFVGGIFVGKSYYGAGHSLWKVGDHRDVMSYLGRNSLIIYLVHQPVILGLLYLMMRKG